MGRDVNKPAEAVLALYRANLDFMKWWLSNFREKHNDHR
jgi:hypothetical protein